MGKTCNIHHLMYISFIFSCLGIYLSGLWMCFCVWVSVELVLFICLDFNKCTGVFRSLSQCIPQWCWNSSERASWTAVNSLSCCSLLRIWRTWPDPPSLTCFDSPLFTLKNMQHAQKSAVTMFLSLYELLTIPNWRWREVIRSAGDGCGSPPANLRLTKKNCWDIWINLQSKTADGAFNFSPCSRFYAAKWHS